MVSLSINRETLNPSDKIRPVNLRTDLAPLADLIELVFADTMDNSGRAALREMRVLSKVGVGLNVLSRLNEMALGINMGYVWIEDDKLVGNVSVYPAHWHPELGSAWIIANVGVHPDYQRRGIAKKLMQASLAMIKQRGGTTAILQMDHGNEKAYGLYKDLGFVEERTWILWRRPAGARLPIPAEFPEVFIAHRRNAEWRSEYYLAKQVRPMHQGGLGWQRPLHPSLFRPSLFKWLNNLLNLRSVERLVIRDEQTQELNASLWIENGSFSSTKLTLMIAPEFAGTYDEALISTAVRRYGGNTLAMEHPLDETTTNNILERYRFYRQRTIINMRWDAQQPL